MEAKAGRIIGIDLAKKTFEVCTICADGNIEKSSYKTDQHGREQFFKHLCAADIVGFEACAYGFKLARELLEKIACKVLVLNPGRLAIIFKSLKKTDAEDARKIAQLIQRNPENELPTVDMPSVHEEEQRAMISELSFHTHSRVRLINRLHSVYTRVGHTEIVKKDLKSHENRLGNQQLLSSYHLIEAQRLDQCIVQEEQYIEEIEACIHDELDKSDQTPVLMSVDGVGPQLAMTFIAYIGRGERFASAPQVSNYVGFTPRIDCSGETNRYGHISKRGCTPLRYLAVQAAWSLIHAKKDSALKTKYKELSARIGKGKAIIAIARKIIELLWLLSMRNELYKYQDCDALKKKLRAYKLSTDKFVKTDRAA